MLISIKAHCNDLLTKRRETNTLYNDNIEFCVQQNFVYYKY